MCRTFAAEISKITAKIWHINIVIAALTSTNIIIMNIIMIITTSTNTITMKRAA